MASAKRYKQTNFWKVCTTLFEQFCLRRREFLHLLQEMYNNADKEKHGKTAKL